MRVLIVGASYVGLACAKSLLSKPGDYEVVLVDPKDFMEVNYMNPRLLQEPERHKDTVKPLTTFSWASKAKFITASVTSMTPSSAQLSNGETVTFDYCVLCTGALSKAGSKAR